MNKINCSFIQISFTPRKLWLTSVQTRRILFDLYIDYYLFSMRKKFKNDHDFWHTVNQFINCIFVILETTKCLVNKNMYHFMFVLGTSCSSIYLVPIISQSRPMVLRIMKVYQTFARMCVFIYVCIYVIPNFSTAENCE